MVQIFVAVGLFGNVRWSEDGKTWTTSGTAGSIILRAVSWSPELGLFAAVGDSGNVRWSEDGKTWTTSGTAGSDNLLAVSWSPELGLFAAVGASGNVRWSSDGKTWTTSGTAGSDNLLAVSWSPELGLFVAVGDYIALWSEDGKTWHAGSSVNGFFRAVSWSPELGLFAAVGFSGKVIWSSDGKNWTETTAGSKNLLAVSWSPELGLFAAVGASGNVRWSSDGKTWTTSGTAGSDTLNCSDWSSELGLFVAAGTSGNVRWSSDGKTWTTSGTAGSVTLYGTAFSKKITVIPDNLKERWVFKPSNVQGSTLIADKGFNASIVKCDIKSRSFEFDNTRQSYCLATTPYDYSGDFTVAIVLNPKLANTTQRLLANGNPGTTGQHFGISASNNRYFYGNGDRSYYTAENSLVTDKLQTFIVTKSSSTYLTNFYIDGLLSGTANQNTGANAAGTTSQYIGASSPTVSNFKGEIFEIRIYDRILSLSEIKKLHSFLYNEYYSSKQVVTNSNFNEFSSSGSDMLATGWSKMPPVTNTYYKEETDVFNRYAQGIISVQNGQIYQSMYLKAGVSYDVSVTYKIISSLSTALKLYDAKDLVVIVIHSTAAGPYPPDATYKTLTARYVPTTSGNRIIYFGMLAEAGTGEYLVGDISITETKSNKLIGYYDLSKIDDNVIKDISKTQNNGIIDYTYCRKGEKGLIFHSGGNLKAGLTLPLDNIYNFSGNFTLGCWIYKTSEDNPYPRLFYKSRTGESNGDVANSSYFFGFNGTSAPNNNLLRFAISSSGGTTDIVSDYAVTLNTWEFVLVTADMLNSIAKIYANGLQVYSDVITSSIEYADYPILIGGSSSSWHFIGEIGECFIFNESLTADEVKKLYITTKNRYL